MTLLVLYIPLMSYRKSSKNGHLTSSFCIMSIQRSYHFTQCHIFITSSKLCGMKQTNNQCRVCSSVVAFNPVSEMYKHHHLNPPYLHVLSIQNSYFTSLSFLILRYEYVSNHRVGERDIQRAQTHFKFLEWRMQFFKLMCGRCGCVSSIRC